MRIERPLQIANDTKIVGHASADLFGVSKQGAPRSYLKRQEALASVSAFNMQNENTASNLLHSVTKGMAEKSASDRRVGQQFIPAANQPLGQFVDAVKDDGHADFRSAPAALPRDPEELVAARISNAHCLTAAGVEGTPSASAMKNSQ